MRNINFAYAILLIVAFFCTGSNIYAQGAISTTDVIRISAVYDAQGNLKQEPIVADGSTRTIVFGLNSSGVNSYTAYNLDIVFPESFTVVTHDNGVAVMPADMAMYPNNGEYSHSIMSKLHDGNIVRVACFSTANDCLIQTEGDLFAIDVTIPSNIESGKYAIRLSGQNLTSNNNQKYVPEDATVEINVQSQLDYYKELFTEYKDSQRNVADALVADGDSDDVLALIAAAKSAIAALEYDDNLTLEQNKAAVDAIIEQLKSDIETQRKADKHAADVAAFEQYKSEQQNAADALAADGDSDDVLALIAAAKSAIAELEYDDDLTLEQNKAAVDAIIEQLKEDIEAQRQADKHAADVAAFEQYKSEQQDAADALAADGDSDDVLALIEAAKAIIAELEYDDDLTLEENKAAVDAIIEQLKEDIEVQREADKHAADVAAFEQYKSDQQNAADALAADGDSDDVLALIEAAKAIIAELEYDDDLTLEENMAIIDAIIEQLEKDVEEARASTGINNHTYESMTHKNIYNTSGVRVNNVTKGNIYVIDRKKVMVK